MKYSILLALAALMTCCSLIQADIHADLEGVWTKNSTADTKSFSNGVYKIIVGGGECHKKKLNSFVGQSR